MKSYGMSCTDCRWNIFPFNRRVHSWANPPPSLPPSTPFTATRRPRRNHVRSQNASRLAGASALPQVSAPTRTDAWRDPSRDPHS